MSSMFAHVETFSRKRSATKRTVHDVLAEARRDPGACSHVENPKPPIVVRGVGVDEVERLHDELVSEVERIDIRGQRRRLRADTNSLYTMVFSHPSAYVDVRMNPEALANIKLWMRDTAAWAADDVARRGGRFLSAIVHIDEAYPHVHAYALHPDGRADDLHPGRVAKKEAFEQALADGATKQQANKAGNNAYRKAMREWQDSHWSECASKHGLLRKGPARQRLTRREFVEARADAALLAERIQQTEEMRETAKRHLRTIDAAAKRMGIDLVALLRESMEDAPQ